jgi:hypothetical protein
MSKMTDTTRRSFLKSGALVAVPAAVVAIPAAALAEDGSKAALARLRDERAIEALNRDFLRAFNQGGAKEAANLFADGKAPALASEVTRLSIDTADTPKSFAIAEDGASATARYDCTVETAHALEGNHAYEQMARLQGNTTATQSGRKVLSAHYVKRRGGWMISKLELI